MILPFALEATLAPGLEAAGAGGAGPTAALDAGRLGMVMQTTTHKGETNRQKADREGRLRIAVFGDGMDWLGVGPLSYFFHNLFALFTLIYLRVEHMLSNEMTQMRHSKENQKRTLHLLSPPCPFRLAGLCNFGRNRFFDKYISKCISSFLVPTT